MKQKLKIVMLMVIMMLISMVGIDVLIPSKVSAQKGNGSSFWLFKEDIGSMNNLMIPQNSVAGMILYCQEHGWGTDMYMTAPEAMDTAYEAETQSGRNNSSYSENGPFFKIWGDYRKQAEHYPYAYDEDGNRYIDWNRKSSCGARNEQDAIESLRNSLPKAPTEGDLGMLSINYNQENRRQETNGIGYIFSSGASVGDMQNAWWWYQAGGSSKDIPGHVNDEPSEENKNLGYEYWKDRTDGGLVDEAYAYEAFQGATANGVAATLNAYNYNKVTKQTSKDYIEESEENGTKTYTYTDSGIEIDRETNSYVLGPFYVDYSANGTAQKTYEYVDTSACNWDGNGCSCNTNTPGPHYLQSKNVSFVAIDGIQVFNQDGKTIESLGGKFKIVYKVGGEAQETDRIDVQEGENAKTAGFEPNKPFYIQVEKGYMKPEDFTGFSAKIGFSYLAEAQAWVSDFIGDVHNYVYQEGPGDPAQAQSDACPDDGVLANGGLVDTVRFTLNRVKTGAHAQKLLGVETGASRSYGKTSIVITSKWEEDEPEIQIEKKCENKDHTDLLSGAFFDVKLFITGKNIYGEEINKELHFENVETTNGVARITTEDLEAKGVYIGKIRNAKIVATFEETKAPAGHIKSDKVHTMTLELDKGKITSMSGDNVSAGDKENSAKITIVNKIGTPKIQLAKVDKEGGLITDKIVEFKIHVSYTRLVDGREELIDNDANFIKGQTKDGYLILTIEDFLSLKDSLDLRSDMGYTGELTLDIEEVAIRDKGTNKNQYSITSDNLDITLKFENGKLVEYGKNKDAEVLVHYAYDEFISEMYEYAKAEKEGRKPENPVSEKAKAMVDEWVKEQQAKLQKQYDEWDKQNIKYTPLKYTDILTAFMDAVDKGEIKKKVEDKSWLSTSKGEAEGQEVIQIAIENKPGIELPDISPERDKEPFTMTVAGKVFLDNRVTKGEQYDANGVIDNDEQFLSGIEVRLIDKETGKLAELYQAKEGESKAPRTNPTMTDGKGYYQFEGVDAFKDYYVEFVYDGMKYENTVCEQAEYNSDRWAISSKGSEIKSQREEFNGKHGEISFANKFYENDEIAGLRNQITKYTLGIMVDENKYPSEKEVRDAMIAAYPEDKEIVAKLDYIYNNRISAYAGYSSVQGGVNSMNDIGKYPFYDLKFMINDDQINESDDNETEFGGGIAKLIYPGQRQIHLGLVERNVTDLRMKTDILNTVVDINGKDTTYKYHNGSASYNQYIYEEDYNYSKTKTEDGKAFYVEGEDDLGLYITYEMQLRNMTAQNTAVTEIVDYFNKDFEWAKEYTLTNGRKLDGIKVINAKDQSKANGINAVVSDTSKYGRHELGESNKGTEYNAKYITFEGRELWLTDNDENDYRVQMTFRVTKPTAKVLLEKLKTEGSDVSKSWLIANYAEITGYKTEGAYIDRNSRPGNFDLNAYDRENAEYSKIMWELIFGGDDIDAEALELKAEMINARIEQIMEDDAWKEVLTLTNSGYSRKITGNVWEAIRDGLMELNGDKLESSKAEFENSLALQSNNRYAVYSDAKDLALGNIKVELIELNDDGTKTVRAVTWTKNDGDNKGEYEFNSYIAGNYVVRFSYGDKDHLTKSEYSKTTYKPKEEADPLPINGQYYQSTKANPKTNTDQYWYKDVTVKDENGEEVFSKNYGKDITRYSDAYDNAETRKEQIEATITETSSSSEYDYDGAYKVESTEHSDVVTSYTSPMELEVEYIRPEVSGSKPNTWYGYQIDGIDLGLTPRLRAQIGIKKTIANIQVKLDGGETILDASYTEDGALIKEEGKYINSGAIVVPDTLQDPSEAFPDNQLQLDYSNNTLLQNSTVYVTYKIVVTNDTEHDGDVYDTIKYVYSKKDNGEEGTEALILYYNEKIEDTTAFEDGTLIEYTKDPKIGLNQDEEEAKGNKASEDGRYTRTQFDKDAEASIVQAGAKQVVDFPKGGIDMIIEDEGNKKLWKEVSKDDYVSMYGSYLAGKEELIGKAYEARDDDEATNPIVGKMNPGERKEALIKLSADLTSGFTGDIIYDNMAEITKIQSDAGKVTDLQGYEKEGAMTSEVRKIADLDPSNPNPTYYPTLTTSRAPVIIVGETKGLSFEDNAVSNLGIVLIVLVVFAGGLVLIKKFVITDKK